jgi:hypothetical protein
MSNDLNGFLRKALANKGQVDIGQFHLLNLDLLKERAGEHWPDRRRKVFDASTHFIEKRISNDNVLVPCSEGFLLIYDEASKMSQEDLKQLGQALEDFLLGSPELESLQVHSETKSVSCAELANIASTEDSRPKPKAQKPVDEPAPPQRPTVTAEPDPDPVTQSPKDPETTKPATPFEGFFHPIWDAGKQAISSNIAFTKYPVEGRKLDGRRVIELRMAPISHSQLDEHTKISARDAFMLFYQKKKPVSICVAVHYTSVATADAREAYLEPLMSIPEPIRKALTFKIEALPHEDPAALEALKQLHQFGARTVAEVPFGTSDLSAFEDCNVSIFSMAARRPSNQETEGLLDHDRRALSLFAESAKKMRALTMLDEVRDMKTVKDAMSSGIRLFTGSAILSDSPRPLPSGRLALVDLYRMSKAA